MLLQSLLKFYQPYLKNYRSYTIQMCYPVMEPMLNQTKFIDQNLIFENSAAQMAIAHFNTFSMRIPIQNFATHTAAIVAIMFSCIQMIHNGNYITCFLYALKFSYFRAP